MYETIIMEPLVLNHCQNEHCSLCLDPIDNGSKTVMLNCRHAFHDRCITTWIRTQTSVSCPVCHTPFSITNSSLRSLCNAHLLFVPSTCQRDCSSTSSHCTIM